MIWFGRYEGWLRMVARGVRDGDRECIRKAAQLFDVMLPDKCIVIPIPSHTGRADRMLDVASVLSTMSANRKVFDALRCLRHESNYSQKKYGALPSVIQMWVDLRYLKVADSFKALTSDIPIYILDNVICSGVTASAALHAFKDIAPNAMVCTLAYSTWR